MSDHSKKEIGFFKRLLVKSSLRKKITKKKKGEKSLAEIINFGGRFRKKSGSAISKKEK